MIKKPSDTSIQDLKEQNYNNAPSVPLQRGDGPRGHLRIVLNTTKYMVGSKNIHWVTPKHAGNGHNLESASKNIQSNQINCQFESNLVAFELYKRAATLSSK
jgi:hypothetical protein